MATARVETRSDRERGPRYAARDGAGFGQCTGALAARIVAPRSGSDRRGAERAFNRATGDRSLRTRPAGLDSHASTFSAARTRARRGCSKGSQRPAPRIATCCSCWARRIGGLGRDGRGRSPRSRSARKASRSGADPWTDEMSGFRRGYAALLKDATAYVVAGQFEPGDANSGAASAGEAGRHRADGSSRSGVRRRRSRRRRRRAARAGGCEGARSFRGLRRSRDGLHASESHGRKRASRSTGRCRSTRRSRPRTKRCGLVLWRSGRSARRGDGLRQSVPTGSPQRTGPRVDGHGADQSQSTPRRHGSLRTRLRS